MKTRIVRNVVLGIIMLGLSLPGMASAGGPGKGCSMLGTWFGVEGADSTVLSGWVVNAMGSSANSGINNLEYPTFDATLGVGLPAVRMSTLRGAWERTGGNTFTYTMIGSGVAADGLTTVWIGKLSGNITISDDCNREHITAVLEVFSPTESPFDGVRLFKVDLPDHYGYRAYVNLPQE